MTHPKLRAVPPSNRGAEAVVLGGLIVDDEVRGKLLSELVEQHFYDPRHREAFEAIMATRPRRRTVTELTVADEIGRRGQLGVPAKAFVAGLLETVGLPREAFAAAEVLRDAHLGRQPLEIIPDIERAALNGVGLQHLELARDTLSALLQDVSKQGVTFEPLNLAARLNVPPDPLRYTHERHIPAQHRRVLAFGAAESGKPMWAAWGR